MMVYGLLHKDTLVLIDQQELTFISSEQIVGTDGKREPKEFMLLVHFDVDDIHVTLKEGYSGGGSYPSAEMQSVYSTAPTDWVTKSMNSKFQTTESNQYNDYFTHSINKWTNIVGSGSTHGITF